METKTTDDYASIISVYHSRTKERNSQEVGFLSQESNCFRVFRTATEISLKVVEPNYVKSLMTTSECSKLSLNNVLSIIGVYHSRTIEGLLKRSAFFDKSPTVRGFRTET